MTQNIGLEVKVPTKESNDVHCPFHGRLSIRGKLFDGKVTGDKAKQTITLQKEAPVYFSKYKRYARSTNTIHAHVPECMEVSLGNRVIAAECRPIAKSVSYVVVEVKE
jgi:small subunit ribosomal protein S17